MKQGNTQAERILELLRSRSPEWIGLPELLDLRMACWKVRILELRRAGHRIENETWMVDGVKQSKYRWLPPTVEPPRPEPTKNHTTPQGLFSPEELRQSRQFGHQDIT